MSSSTDNINLKDGADLPFKMRTKDVSAGQDASLHAVRPLATLYPVDYGLGGCYHTTVKSGIVAAGLGGASPILAFRNPSLTLNAIIRKVRLLASSHGTGFAAGIGFIEMYVARSFTAMDTNGSLVTLTSPQAKLKTSMAAASSAIGFSSTAGLTAGTRTLDSLPVESINANVTTGTYTPFIGSAAGPAKLFEKQQGEHPLILAANEGFVLQATVPGTGTWFWTAAIEWDEVPLNNF